MLTKMKYKYLKLNIITIKNIYYKYIIEINFSKSTIYVEMLSFEIKISTLVSCRTQ